MKLPRLFSANAAIAAQSDAMRARERVIRRLRARADAFDAAARVENARYWTLIDGADADTILTDAVRVAHDTAEVIDIDAADAVAALADATKALAKAADATAKAANALANAAIAFAMAAEELDTGGYC